MEKVIVKFFIYMLAIIIGVPLGLLLSAYIVDYELLVNGESVLGYAPEEITAKVLAGSGSIHEHSRLRFGNAVIFETEGVWLMWAVNLLPVVLCLVVANVLIRIYFGSGK
jgi:hypothetical protein